MGQFFATWLYVEVSSYHRSSKTRWFFFCFAPCNFSTTSIFTREYHTRTPTFRRSWTRITWILIILIRWKVIEDVGRWTSILFFPSPNISESTMCTLHSNEMICTWTYIILSFWIIASTNLTPLSPLCVLQNSLSFLTLLKLLLLLFVPSGTHPSQRKCTHAPTWLTIGAIHCTRFLSLQSVLILYT